MQRGNHEIKTKQIQHAARRWKREQIGSRIGMESTVCRISGGLCSIQNLSGHESVATEFTGGSRSVASKFELDRTLVQ